MDSSFLAKSNLIYELKKLIFHPFAGKETYYTDPFAGTETYCTDAWAGKEIMALIHEREKGVLMDVLRQSGDDERGGAP